MGEVPLYLGKREVIRFGEFNEDRKIRDERGG